jgi:hypothetical protein
MQFGEPPSTEQVYLTLSFSKREDITVARIKQREVFHNMHSSSNIIRLVKSRIMGQAEHVARMGKREKLVQNISLKPDGEENLETVAVWTIY